MAKYPDQTRNLNPTFAARVAMTIWGKEYSEQRGGSMDFWDSLDDDRKKRCEIVASYHLKAVQEAQAKAWDECADSPNSNRDVRQQLFDDNPYRGVKE